MLVLHTFVDHSRHSGTVALQLPVKAEMDSPVPVNLGNTALDAFSLVSKTNVATSLGAIQKWEFSPFDFTPNELRSYVLGMLEDLHIFQQQRVSPQLFGILLRYIVRGHSPEVPFHNVGN